MGLGRVGSEVAKIGKAFGMQVIAWSENLNLDKCKELDVLPCSKEDVLKTSDFLSIHVQGGERYKELIKLKELDMMKKTAFLINISGNDVWDFEYLSQKTKDKSIAGIALDDDRRGMEDSDANILITPHMAWYTKEAFAEDFRIWTECILSITNDDPINVVN